MEVIGKMRNAECKMRKVNVEWWVKCGMRNGKGVTYFALRSDYSSGHRKNSGYAIHTVTGRLADVTIYPVTCYRQGAETSATSEILPLLSFKPFA